MVFPSEAGRDWCTWWRSPQFKVLVYWLYLYMLLQVTGVGRPRAARYEDK